jgi:hypothetical protein
MSQPQILTSTAEKENIHDLLALTKAPKVLLTTKKQPFSPYW